MPFATSSFLLLVRTTPDFFLPFLNQRTSLSLLVDRWDGTWAAAGPGPHERPRPNSLNGAQQLVDGRGPVKKVRISDVPLF